MAMSRLASASRSSSRTSFVNSSILMRFTGQGEKDEESAHAVHTAQRTWRVVDGHFLGKQLVARKARPHLLDLALDANARDVVRHNHCGAASERAAT